MHNLGVLEPSAHLITKWHSVSANTTPLWVDVSVNFLFFSKIWTADPCQELKIDHQEVE